MSKGKGRHNLFSTARTQANFIPSKLKIFNARSNVAHLYFTLFLQKIHQVLGIDEIPDLPRDSSIGEEKNGEDIKEEV